MFEFSDQFKAILLNAGWYERNIEIEQIVEFAQREQYLVAPTIEIFLKESGELYLIFLLHDGQEDLLHFDARKAIGDIVLEWVVDYSKRLNNINLCVIGQAFSNHLTIMMADDGKVYGGFDDNLYFIAHSGRECIQAIFSNSKFKEISMVI